MTASIFKLRSHNISRQLAVLTILNRIHISRSPQVAMASPNSSLAGQLVLSTIRPQPQRHQQSSSPASHGKRSNLSNSSPTNNLINVTTNQFISNSLRTNKFVRMVKAVEDTNQESQQEVQLPSEEPRSTSTSHTTKASHMLETKTSTYLICNRQSKFINQVIMIKLNLK